MLKHRLLNVRYEELLIDSLLKKNCIPDLQRTMSGAVTLREGLEARFSLR